VPPQTTIQRDRVADSAGEKAGPCHTCLQEAVIRTLVERLARTFERCNHLEACVERIERKLDSFGERIDRKLEEVDRTLNGRLGSPGLIARVTFITLIVSSLGSLGIGILLFVSQRFVYSLVTGG